MCGGLSSHHPSKVNCSILLREFTRPALFIQQACGKDAIISLTCKDKVIPSIWLYMLWVDCVYLCLSLDILLINY